MTISSTVDRVDYVGNGSTATYSYPFRIFSATDLLVLQRDASNNQATLALSTDYTVTGVGELNGGTISLNAGNLATGKSLTIKRVRPLLQDSDIRNQGDFFPEVFEDTFDKLIMIDQQQQDAIDRSFKLQDSLPPDSVSATLPAPSPNQVLGWNNDATALINVEPGTLLTVAGSQNQIVDAYKSANGDFTAGSTTTLTLSQIPGSASNVMITFNGVVQNHSTFMIVGSVVTFNSAISVGTTVVEAQYMQTLPVDTAASENVTFIQNGTGAITTDVRNRLRERLCITDFGAVGDGTTDCTVAIQKSLDAAGPFDFSVQNSGAIFVPPGTFQYSNIVMQESQTLYGVSRQCSILRSISGSTGFAITDNGNAAKIVLRDLGIFANNCSYDSVVRLGYATDGQFGTEGLIQNIWIRDCPNVGLDINANVGLIRGASVWNIGTGVKCIGNGNTLHDIFVAGFSTYGIYTGNSFLYGIELEAPATGAVPFYMNRQAHLYGATISLADATSIDHLFEYEDNNVTQSTISGLNIFKTGTGDYTTTVKQDGLTFGKQTPYFEGDNFLFNKKSSQLVLVDDAYASARSYTITVKSTHPDIIFALHTDVAQNVTFDFSDTVANYQGRKFQVVNNTAAKTAFVKGSSGGLFIATQLFFTDLNYDQTIGLPIRHGCTLEFSYAGMRGSNIVPGLLTHPEEDLTGVPQNKYWQGEIIRNKASLVGTSGNLCRIVTTTGYVIKEAWTTGDTYAIGDYVSNASKVYQATNAGVAGATAPTHTSGTVSDGTVSWLFIEAYTAVAYKTVTVS